MIRLSNAAISSFLLFPGFEESGKRGMGGNLRETLCRICSRNSTPTGIKEIPDKRANLVCILFPNTMRFWTSNAKFRPTSRCNDRVVYRRRRKGERAFSALKRASLFIISIGIFAAFFPASRAWLLFEVEKLVLSARKSFVVVVVRASHAIAPLCNAALSRVIHYERSSYISRVDTLS